MSPAPRWARARRCGSRPFVRRGGRCSGCARRPFSPAPKSTSAWCCSALWLFAQLNPATLLFGTGDLRDFLAPTQGGRARPEFFVSIEALTTAANLAAVGLLLSVLVAPGWPARAMFGGAGGRRAGGQERWRSRS